MMARQRISGFTLLEVLITLVVVSIGLLTLVGLHVRAEQASFEGYQRSQALILLEDMVNRMKINRPARRCYDFTNPATGAPYVGQGSGVSPGYACAGWGTTATRNMANIDVDAWHNALLGAAETFGGNPVGAMVGARGCISYDVVADAFTVSVAWQGDIPTQAPANNCATGLYGDEAQRRVLSATVQYAELD